jgi:hypothetical protein
LHLCCGGLVESVLSKEAGDVRLGELPKRRIGTLGAERRDGHSVFVKRDLKNGVFVYVQAPAKLGRERELPCCLEPN